MYIDLFGAQPKLLLSSFRKLILQSKAGPFVNFDVCSKANEVYTVD